MSSMKSVQLTKEEEEYLKSLEEEFKDRYTENDEEFQAVLKTKLPLPPILKDWSHFRRDNFRYNRDRYSDQDNRYSGQDNRYSGQDNRYSGQDNRYSNSSEHDYRRRERTHASLYRPY